MALASGAALVPALEAAAVAAGATTERREVGFRVVSVNVRHTLPRDAVIHDVRAVIRRAKPSLIGFQERGGSKPVLRAALPDHWGLVMPNRRRSATDNNPIAYDTRVWSRLDGRARVLTKRTWRRSNGRWAGTQYAVVAELQHRETGHTVRAVSFHMPPRIHDLRSGGPNWRLQDRVEAFWRMAAAVRDLARTTPPGTQFIAMCDCNVHFHRDRTPLLVRGKLARPLRLEHNYSAGRRGPGRQIDYVMAQRRAPFRIVDGWALHGLRTDHPAVLARFSARHENPLIGLSPTAHPEG